METKEQSIEEIFESVGCCMGDYCEYGEHKKRFTKELSSLVNQACIDVLEEYVKRVKPLLNTVTSQETLEVMFEKFKAEKNLVNESEVSGE